MALHEAQRLGAGGRDRHELIGRRQREGFSMPFEIVDRVVVAERLAHLLGQALAALIVAQHPEALAQAGHDPVPAVERSAHFVQQHHDRPAAGPPADSEC